VLLGRSAGAGDSGALAGAAVPGGGSLGASTARTRPPDGGVAGRSRRRRRLLAIDGEHVGEVVVDDHGAGDLIVQHRPTVAAQFGAGDKAHVVGLAVVFDDFAFAFDELVRRSGHGVALLAEERPFACLGRDHAVLVAVGVLAHIQPRAAQHDGALGHHHAAREHAGLLEFIVPQGVGLDVHGLGTVCLFGMCHARKAGQGCEHKEGE